MLLTIGYTLFQSMAAGNAAREQVQLTTDILRHLRTSLRMGLNAETGQRGYLLTGDDLYLEAYDVGSREWIKSIDTLDQALADVATQDQAEAVGRMRDIATRKLEELAETVALARAGDRDAALDVVDTDLGKRLMDRFRNEVAALEDQEQQILSTAITRAELIEARTLPTLLLLTASIVALAALGFWLERRTAYAEAQAREADQLRLARERSDLLARELNHRVKNLFAVILSIVSITGRDGSPEVRRVIQRLRERILALSLAHDVSQGKLERDIIDLRDLLVSTLEPYREDLNEDSNRIQLQGPDVRIPVKAVTPLGLVVHELATNAAKYGALSVQAGTVRITWSMMPNHGANKPRTLRLVWSEVGAPAGEATTTEGFGTIMLRQATRQLSGTIEKMWSSRGLEAVIEFPLPDVAIDAERSSS